MRNIHQDKAITEILASKSDRVIAVVGGALVEQSLEIALKQRLRQNAGILDALFNVDGALGSFAPKIHLGFLLHMYEMPVRDALSAIAKIRNRFAHELDVSFESDDENIVKGLAKFNLHQGQTHYPDALWASGPQSKSYSIDKIENNRDLFIVTVKICLLLLMRDTKTHFPWCNTPTQDVLQWRWPPSA